MSYEMCIVRCRCKHPSLERARFADESLDEPRLCAAVALSQFSCWEWVSTGWCDGSGWCYSRVRLVGLLCVLSRFPLGLLKPLHPVHVAAHDPVQSADASLRLLERSRGKLTRRTGTWLREEWKESEW